MSKTTEKQRRYRDKRILNGERRVNLWLPVNTLIALGAITEHLGISNRELIIRFTEVMEDLMIRGLDSAT